MTDTRTTIFAHYINVAEVLGAMFAPILEVVVHDLRTPEHSIIAIYNGHLSGRQVGDAATDLGRRLLDGSFPDRVIGYPNETPDGQKLKSSSLAIRDDNGEVIGVLGLNLDIAYFDQFGKFISHMISTTQSPYVTEAELFEISTPSDDIKDAIQHFLIQQNWTTRTLSNTDKRAVVAFLYRKGYFKNRGAVTIIARELGLSRPSVYNYRRVYINNENGTTKQDR